jgi:hypothetical protein
VLPFVGASGLLHCPAALSGRTGCPDRRVRLPARSTIPLFDQYSIIRRATKRQHSVGKTWERIAFTLILLVSDYSLTRNIRMSRVIWTMISHISSGQTMSEGVRQGSPESPEVYIPEAGELTLNPWDRAPILGRSLRTADGGRSGRANHEAGFS